ncbi:MAG: HEAT repeat domain-containing protein [Candidatus Zhuqueibacterota bacterium]
MRGDFIRYTWALFLILLVAQCRKQPFADPNWQALVALEDSRTRDVTAIYRLLRDENPDIRARAALALARLQYLSSADSLSRRLTDSEASVREMAAFSLGQIGLSLKLHGDTTTNVAERRLLSALAEENDLAVQSKIVDALGSAGTRASVPLLLQLARGQNLELQATAIQSLGSLAYWNCADPAIALELVEFLRSPNAAVRWKTAYALMRLKNDSTGTPLADALHDAEPLVRIFATRALGEFRNRSFLPNLIGSLHTSDWRVRVNAVRAIERMGDSTAASSMFPLLSDRSEHVQRTAIAALGSLKSRAAIEKLMAISRSGQPVLAGEAVVSLAHMMNAGALPVIESFHASESVYVRRQAARALGLIDHPQSYLLLRRQLNDPDAGVRTQAIESIGQIGMREYRSEAIQFFREKLKNPDIADATVIAQICANHTLVELIPELMTAYGQFTHPDGIEPRTAIIQTLGELKSESALPLLRGALEDEFEVIRLAAVQSLKMITGRDYPMPERAAPEAILPAEKYAALTLKKAQATIETNRGLIVVELHPLDAPFTVANFIRLAEEGFYDGVIFHRVVSDFVIQAGCPRGDGWGGPGQAIRCEINLKKYGRGTMGMALAGKDTGGSQFFITHSPQPHLDGRYTVFGQVVHGMEIVDKIQPFDVILKIRIDKS